METMFEQFSFGSAFLEAAEQQMEEKTMKSLVGKSKSSSKTTFGSKVQGEQGRKLVWLPIVTYNNL